MNTGNATFLSQVVRILAFLPGADVFRSLAGRICGLSPARWFDDASYVVVVSLKLADVVLGLASGHRCGTINSGGATTSNGQGILNRVLVMDA